MAFTQLKQLFLIGFLGLTLVGCSSTPTAEEGSDGSSASAASAGSSSAKGQGSSNASGSSTSAAEAKAAEEAAIKESQDLYAKLQGQVVNFDFDRSEVKADFYSVIKINADYMALNPNAMVTISGHCDERGTREYNLALGERRANAVKNALIAEGVSPSRISTKSYGEENPVALGHDESSWAKNRRAEFSY